jgi:molybdate transport system ATP-binding protein
VSQGLSASFSKTFSGGPRILVENLEIPNSRGITVLFGESGAGKTTVLRCLAGLDRPDSGTIAFDGEAWFDASHRILAPSRTRRIGLLPQDYALFPHLSVEKNIAYGLHDLSQFERRERVAEAVQWLGLDGLDRRFPNELSGGQQQRVALARAVVRRPRLLLLDEPLSALDAPTRLRLRWELGRLLQQLGIPTVLVTHDRTEVLALGDNLIVMARGRIIQRGPVSNVFRCPATVEAAAILSVETVQAGRVLQTADGLATVSVGERKLKALAPDLPSGTLQVFVCIRGEDVILMRGEPGRSSPRNCFPARVQTLQHEGPMVRVELDCGFSLTAVLTRQACDELALAVGEQVLALIKAPQIHLIPRAAAS